MHVSILFRTQACLSCMPLCLPCSMDTYGDGACAAITIAYFGDLGAGHWEAAHDPDQELGLADVELPPRNAAGMQQVSQLSGLCLHASIPAAATCGESMACS